MPETGGNRAANVATEETDRSEGEERARDAFPERPAEPRLHGPVKDIILAG